MLEVTHVSLEISCQKHLPIPRRCVRRKWSLKYPFVFFINLHSSLFSVTDERHIDPPVQLQSIPGMDDAEFRQRGKEMIDYIADYLKHIR